MSAGNGVGYDVRTAGEFRERAASAQPSFTDMSSHQRSVSLDNMAQQIADLSVGHNMLAAAINTLTKRFESEWHAHEAHLVTLQMDGREWREKTSSFMARLRWLLTGR